MRTATFARVIPATVLRRVTDRPAFLNEIARYIAMDDDALLRATETCLKNLGRPDSTAARASRCSGTLDDPDSSFQIVLVPELWERLRPGTRDVLRRISSTLAEYNPDPARPSLFARQLSSETRTRLCESASDLRQRVTCTARIDDQALVEQVRFAIAGSRVADRWEPTDFVYESGFVYRLVPAIAWQVLVRSTRLVRA